MGTSISFKRPDGKDASGYLANAERGNAPGVIVIQEWWGLSDQIKGLCDRFALPASMRWRPISTRARWCRITTPTPPARR